MDSGKHVWEFGRWRIAWRFGSYQIGFKRRSEGHYTGSLGFLWWNAIRRGGS